MRRARAWLALLALAVPAWAAAGECPVDQLTGDDVDALNSVAIQCHSALTAIEDSLAEAQRLRESDPQAAEARRAQAAADYQALRPSMERLRDYIKAHADEPAFQAVPGDTLHIPERFEKLGGQVGAQTETQDPPKLPPPSQESGGFGVQTCPPKCGAPPNQPPRDPREEERRLPPPTPGRDGDSRQYDRVAGDYLAGGRPRDAGRVLDRLIGSGTQDPDAYLLRGEARRLAGDWKGAYDDVQQALALGTRNPYADELLGTARMQLERLGLAPAPKRPDFGAPGGGPEAAEKTAGAPGSGATLELPVVIPGGPVRAPAQALFAAAESKYRLRDYRGALLELSRLLARDPRNVRALALRARVLNRGRNPQAALRDAEEALKLSPDDPDALRERAYALLELGRAEEALSELARAIRLDPKNAMGYLYRAMALEKLGRREEALKDYARAAQLDPALRSFYEEASAPGGTPAKKPARGVTRRRIWGLVGLLGTPLVLLGLWPLWRRAAALTTSRRDSPPPPAEPAPDGTLAAGSLLAGTYQVGRVLGRGGMGVVLEARDLVLERLVAIKQLRVPEDGGGELELLLREARVVAALRHPNLVQIHAVVEDGGRLYLVFEHVEGRPLDQVLAARGRLHPAELGGLLKDVCAALDYAHGQRVIHRDLKPGNVMLTADGSARVMDFGIAHRARAESGQTLTQAWGTPPYMAPEQELGTVSRESDLYALGVMTYELLAGARPFAGDGRAEKLAGRFAPVTAAAPGLPPGLDAFFARALAPDPARRFHSGAELAQAYAAALEPRGAPAPRRA